ncbi:hypothetical protein QWY85_10480 [Neolewinella lacunae]|uniref:Uncharacterized protein n=1 Tax=Neolewinella lacunae TaxID=1517758 RepID=A0A923PJX8_9BACT|nr:hypothetical protein [Neolewinella lacunae]MBC6995498.1 hypothetical protein [Neolewinella lacunae]MDN3635086.1 hypothetical protein [Neolewinella lacunae]
MNRLLFLGLLAITLFTTACGGDDDGGGPGFCTNETFSNDISAAVSRLSDAALAYSNDPSTANCNAYKNAARDYLDEVRRFEGCATLNTRQEFRDALREAEESVDMIQC